MKEIGRFKMLDVQVVGSDELFWTGIENFLQKDDIIIFKYYQSKDVHLPCLVDEVFKDRIRVIPYQDIDLRECPFTRCLELYVLEEACRRLIVKEHE